ncbi:hypothetical protein AVEN_380-1 [Araneus ventricosus]|uniref:Uncharacterized protein n=1 Tax=Araneus ventricosus TaxID=182803 RepID=A0A4Y2DRY4_ARAVE|nr:hypothetical protein AVEN_380-1 [Araneus ventricosus]
MHSPTHLYRRLLADIAPNSQTSCVDGLLLWMVLGEKSGSRIRWPSVRLRCLPDADLLEIFASATRFRHLLSIDNGQPGLRKGTWWNFSGGLWNFP